MAGNSSTHDPRRDLPAVGTICADPAAAVINSRFGAATVVDAVRMVLGETRARIAAGHGVDTAVLSLIEMATLRLEARERETLFPVINATGIVIHTNLGRAPLAPEARAAIEAVSGYGNLDYDLEGGQRASRQDHLAPLIAQVTGAETGLAVNNGAGAVLLALASLAAGAPIIVSRGELVEIGGGFRVPDVVAQSGSRSIEIGTTNRTHLRDYERAVREQPEARIILRTHPSNFRITGFTSTPSLSDLAAFAHANRLILIEDLGGGALVDLAAIGIPGEPRVQDSLRAGADLVVFSGDKLLGGPQAGIVAGRKGLIASLAAHPLARALRLDKASVAALAATLKLYRPPADPMMGIPVLRMLSQTIATLQTRAEALQAMIAGVSPLRPVITDTTGYAGGGAMPMHGLPGRALALTVDGTSADALARKLRTGRTRVIGRIEQDRVLLEMRTIADEELPRLAAAVRDAAAG